MQVGRRAVLGGLAACGLPTSSSSATAQISDESRWAQTWDAALATLAANVNPVPQFDAPVLFEGPIFQGIWQECGPHEALGYAELAEHVRLVSGKVTPLEVARQSHRVFFVNQRADGQLPAYLSLRTGVNFSQIQMV